MTPKLLNAGVYDAQEVSHLLGQHVELVLRWSSADGKGLPPIVAPTFPRTFSFVDLVSFAVVRELRNRGVSEADMRRGVEWLQHDTGLDKPLSHSSVAERIATSGTSMLARASDSWCDIGKGGQGAFEQIVQLYLQAVSYNDLGVARL